MNALFEKCIRDRRAEAARLAGIYPYFHRLESRQDVEVVMEGRRRIMLGSNNYLGLTTCPEVVEAGIRALEKYGTGCSGSRFLNGTLELHLELEAELADFLGKEEALTFGTGFQTNLGIISALVGRHDYLICDKEAHASVYCAAHAAMVLPEAGGEGVTVLDSRRVTVSGYYHELAAEFLPGKRLREVALPMALIRPVAALSTMLSRREPIFDPTLYALDTISHNLDFSNRRMLAWLAKAGLEEY